MLERGAGRAAVGAVLSLGAVLGESSVLGLGAVLGELYCVTTAGPMRLNCTTVVGERL